MKIQLFSGKFYVLLIFIIGLLFHSIGLIRYVNRLPGDWFGISLYIATIVAFLLGVFILITESKN